MEELNTTNVITDMPGICEPGAEQTLNRMLVFAKAACDQFYLAMERSEGEQTRAFAREMHGQMSDHVKEIRARLFTLLAHYQTKLLFLQDEMKEMDLNDIVDIMHVENRLIMRVNNIKTILDHA